MKDIQENTCVTFRAFDTRDEAEAYAERLQTAFDRVKFHVAQFVEAGDDGELTRDDEFTVWAECQTPLRRVQLEQLAAILPYLTD